MTDPASSPFPLGLRAVVVDEWALFRQGIVSVLANLGVEVTGEASGAEEGLMRLWAATPDLLVAGSPAGSRLPDLIVTAKESYPQLRVLALVPSSEAGGLRAVLSSGADAVLSRLASTEELEDALRRVVAGERVLAAAALSVLVGKVEPVAGPTEAALTAKEFQVLSLLAKGLSNRDIADALVLSGATVKSHLTHIYSKLGVASRQEAVGRAIELGILA